MHLHVSCAVTNHQNTARGHVSLAARSGQIPCSGHVQESSTSVLQLAAAPSPNEPLTPGASRCDSGPVLQRTPGHSGRSHSTHSPNPGDSRDSHHKPCKTCDGASLLVVVSTTGALQARYSRHPTAPAWSCHCLACSEWGPLPAGHGTSNSASRTAPQPQASSTSPAVHGGSKDTSKWCCFSMTRSPRLSSRT